MRPEAWFTLGLVVALALLLCPGKSSAGNGLVALQTADPSCADDSGNTYVDCGNGTVTDNRTGLVWLANANCWGLLNWHHAMEVVAGLADQPAGSAAAADDCGLSDGSSPGEWRLPSKTEWEAMVADALGQGGDPDCTASPPTITNDSGGACLSSGPTSFSGVQSSFHWSSTTNALGPTGAWFMDLKGLVEGNDSKSFVMRVWPVRGGQ